MWYILILHIRMQETNWNSPATAAAIHDVAVSSGGHCKK